MLTNAEFAAQERRVSKTTLPLHPGKFGQFLFNRVRLPYFLQILGPDWEHNDLVTAVRAQFLRQKAIGYELKSFAGVSVDPARRAGRLEINDRNVGSWQGIAVG